MNGRLLAILAGLAVAAVLAALAFRAGDAGDARWRAVGEPVFPGLAERIGDAAELAVEKDDHWLTLRRDGEIWRLAESDGYLADPAVVGRALLGLAEMSYVEPKTRRPELWFKLGLGVPGQGGERTEKQAGKQKQAGGQVGEADGDSPARRVVLRDASGAVLADLVTGKELAFIPGEVMRGVYFRLPGSPQTWLGRSSPGAGAAPGEWLRRRIVDIDESRVMRVTVRHPDGETMVVSRDDPKARLRLHDMPEGRRLKYDSDTDLIGAFLDKIELEDVRRRKTGPDGIRDGDIFTPARTTDIRVETFDGLTTYVETAETDGEHWLRLVFAGSNAESTAEAAELAAQTEAWRYRVGAYETAAVLRRMDDLLAPAGDRETGN